MTSEKKLIPYWEDPMVTLSYHGNRSLRFSSKEIDSGTTQSYIPFHTADHMVIRCFPEDWVLDLDTTGIYSRSRLGGRLDGLDLAANTTYLIYAFANRFGQFQGYGAFQIPSSSYTVTSGTKGTVATFTNITKGYRFSKGARVRCEVSNSEWNLGTITEIVSETQLKVLLDDDTVFNKTYGSNLTNPGNLTQLDQYRPFLPDDPNQQVYYPYFRILARIQTNASMNLEGLLQYPHHHYSHIGFIHAWHQHLGNLYRILPPSYVSMDGLVCKVDQSPFIGETLEDLNGDARFLRGGSVSGGMEDATRILVTPTDISGALRLYMESYDQNASLLSSSRTYYQTTGLTSGGTTDFAYTTRPINMSVVWVMRVA